MIIRKNKLIKLGVLFLGISYLLWNCEIDHIIEEQEIVSSEIQQTPIINTVAFENAGQVFNRLKNEFQLDPYLQLVQQTNGLARTTQDTLGVTIYTDEIKEITLGNYTSYTMRIVNPENENSKFHNLTIEDKNGQSDMFVTKYEPSENWLNDTSKSFEGSASRISMNDLTHEGDEDDGESNDTTGGGGSNDYSSPQGSPYYPTNCNGMVIVTMETVAIRCECATPGHLPGQCIGECNAQGYYAEIPYYYCDPDNTDSDNGDSSDSYNDNNPNTGGGGTSGDGGGTNPDTTSITVLLGPGEECDSPPPGDLNGDCQISYYEACLMNGNSQEVCDCVAEGNDLDACIKDYWNNYFTNNPEEWVIYEEVADEIDLGKYLKCFDNIPAFSTFKLTVYIDQPIPNKNDTWTNDGSLIDPDINVGHTFISFEMNDGTTTTNQTIGFYPLLAVNPTSPQIAGKWVDDGNHDYDVSVSVAIDSIQFTSLISNITTLGTPTYNLNSLNCTDAALQIGNGSGMNLPDTNGSWIGGGGSNPGNLGQDVRGLTNSSLTISTIAGTASLSKGPCN